jgi:hypothetical protein
MFRIALSTLIIMTLFLLGTVVVPAQEAGGELVEVKTTKREPKLNRSTGEWMLLLEKQWSGVMMRTPFSWLYQTMGLIHFDTVWI